MTNPVPDKDMFPPIDQILKTLDELSGKLGMGGMHYADAARAIRHLQDFAVLQRRQQKGLDWQPMETAPKSRPILVWHDDKSDPYYDPIGSEATQCEKLTTYGAHLEGLLCTFIPGVYQARWGGAYNSPDRYIPAWWFKDDDGIWESPLAPTHWAEINSPDNAKPKEMP